RLVSKRPAPAIDVIEKPNPSIGIKLLSLRFLPNLHNVIIILNDRQVGIYGLAESSSITPCLSILDEGVRTGDRQHKWGHTCGGKFLQCKESS
ncbi:CASP-like protein 2D1, partial [Clarias magur]